MKHFFTLYLVFILVLVGSIFAFAVVNPVHQSAEATETSESQSPLAVDTPADPSLAAEASAESASTLESDTRAYQPLETDNLRTKFSLATLAQQYLGADSQITTVGTIGISGVEHYSGNAKNHNHCQLSIVISSQYPQLPNGLYDEKQLKSSIFCQVASPTFRDYQFNQYHATIETVSLSGYDAPLFYDADAGLEIDLKTYNALLALLTYYSGDLPPESYQGDPLSNCNIEYNFAPTYPKLVPHLARAFFMKIPQFTPLQFQK